MEESGGGEKRERGGRDDLFDFNSLVPLFLFFIYFYFSYFASEY